MARFVTPRTLLRWYVELVKRRWTLRLPKTRLFPMSDRDKDTEILALRHQIAVLERQLGNEKVRFTPADRAFLAALLHRLPREALRRLRLLVRPDTIPPSPTRSKPFSRAWTTSCPIRSSAGSPS
jgi:hypothetical protein